MDKSHTELLGEIRSEIERLKGALAALEEKLAACEADSGLEAAAAADFTDFEIGTVEDLEDLPEAPAAEVPEPEAVAEPAAEAPAEPAAIAPSGSASVGQKMASESTDPRLHHSDAAAEPEAIAPSGSASVGQEMASESTNPRLHHSDAAAEPEAEAPAAKPKAKPALEGNYAWQQARPGVSVKHIRSGISLLDRAQFITILFKEDYALYDSTLASLESMESLDDAVQYLMDQFPQWNYKSDIVFSFMMAVRKKLG